MFDELCAGLKPSTRVVKGGALKMCCEMLRRFKSTSGTYFSLMSSDVCINQVQPSVKSINTIAHHWLLLVQLWILEGHFLF